MTEKNKMGSIVKRVIDDKIKQNQDLKEFYEKYPLDISNESIISLINMAINDLETIKFLYLHELKDKEKEKEKENTNEKTSN